MNKTFLPFIMGQLRPVAISLLTALMLVGGSSFAWGDELTVYSGATTSDYIIPISGKNLSNTNFKSEFVIPSSELTAMQGMQISKMTFYIKTSSSGSWGDAEFQVFLKEVDSPSLTALTGTTGATIVYEGSLDATGSTMVINFTSSTYDYVNKNLLVGIYCTNAGTPSSNDVYYYAQSFVSTLDYATAAFYTTYAGTRKYIPKTTFEYSIPETYKRPKNLKVLSSSLNSATLSWTAGGSFDGEKWQIAYSTKKNFDPDTEGVKVGVTANPYTLSNLVDGVTYYARVRSNYSGNYSAWCNDELEFKLKTDISLCSDYENKTSANVAVPNYTANESYLTKSQMIYPYSDVSVFAGKYVTQLTFYANTSSIDWGTATYDIYLGETTTSAFGYSATFIDWSNCTKVVEGTTLKVSDGKLVINLTTPFLYTGADSKNLLVGFQQTAVSESTVSSTWYAKNITSSYPSAAYYNTGSYTYTTGQSYLPYLTISYVSSTTPVTIGTNGFTTFASPRALDLRKDNLPDGLTAYKAESVDGTKIRFTSLDQTVPANTGVLLAGTANTPYDIPVVASGDAVSGNLFHVNSTGGTFTAAGYTCYGLMKATKSDDKLVFATFDPSAVAIPTNKAYLMIEETGSARQLTCVFDDETTGLQEISNEKLVMSNYYNLAGQRVAQPTKGLYIKNGRKVIVK